ncbi:hypothetical protein Pst134EA_029351 [Puccinia striiformis f. sp. tritici]|uniref:hypothetical protein n=1 Tax=Puccinia striiformis f. sp. tritici TaxID=168172 RepID=UPI002007CEC1|nr:hypothetical protein Pst134EA_029351 [Puccinia striiformis f. sp. tritici]KAH9447317.1 hypothetical protein Pst134EA_029351 [Puccinia striiformis f. sp. tritici]
MELFKLPAVMNTVQTHIQLLFRIWGQSFFDKPESVIPQIEFLETSPTLKHFHRAIAGRNSQIEKERIPNVFLHVRFCRQSIINLSLETVLLRGPENTPDYQKQLDSCEVPEILQSLISRLGYEFAKPDEPFSAVSNDESSENALISVNGSSKCLSLLFHHNSWLYQRSDSGDHLSSTSGWAKDIKIMPILTVKYSL